jgi:hypothetical protein
MKLRTLDKLERIGFGVCMAIVFSQLALLVALGIIWFVNFLCKFI